jgi:UDP-glucose 4-epimerase
LLALVGNAALLRRVADRQVAAGETVCGFGEAAPPGWGDAEYRVADGAGALEQALREAAPDSVILFGSAVDAGLLDACRDAGCRRVIYWGTARAYGRARQVHGRALLEGDLDRAERPGAALRPERTVQDWGVENPGVEVYVFRACDVLSGDGDNPLDALGALRLVPTPRRRGYLQYLDERDAVEILVRALRGGHPGVYNAGADGIVRLSDLLVDAGRSEIRLPGFLVVCAAYLAYITGRITSPRGFLDFTAGTVLVDNARLKTHLGYRPRYSTRAALLQLRAREVGA